MAFSLGAKIFLSILQKETFLAVFSTVCPTTLKSTNYLLFPNRNVVFVV